MDTQLSVGPFSARELSQRGLCQARAIDAPPEWIWALLSDPFQLRRFWAPYEYKSSLQKFGMNEGGKIHWAFEDPAGQKWDWQLSDLKIKALKSIHGQVHDPLSAALKHYQLYLHWHGQGLHTECNYYSLFKSSEERDLALKKAGLLEWGREWLTRLGELAQLTLQHESLVMEYDFNASLAELWSFWSDPHKLALWLSGGGQGLKIHQYDFKAGGQSLYSSKNPLNGEEEYGRSDFWAIKEEQNIVMVQGFSDKDYNYINPLAMPEWPARIWSQVAFKAKSRTLSSVRLTQCPLYASPSEYQRFQTFKGLMREGWTRAFENLVRFLSPESPSRAS